MSGQRRSTLAQKGKWASHRPPPSKIRLTSVSSDPDGNSSEGSKAQPKWTTLSYATDSVSSSEEDEEDELESSDEYSDSNLTPFAKKLKEDMSGPRPVIPKRVLWTELLGDGHIDHEPDQERNKLYTTTWGEDSYQLKNEKERLKREAEEKKNMKHVLRRIERDRREAEKRWVRGNPDKVAAVRELGFEFTDEDSCTTTSETETDTSDLDVDGLARGRPKRPKLRGHADNRLPMSSSVFEKQKKKAELEPIKPEAVLNLKGKHAPLLTYDRSKKSLSALRRQDQNPSPNISDDDDDGSLYFPMDEGSSTQRRSPEPEQEKPSVPLLPHSVATGSTSSVTTPSAIPMASEDFDDLPDFEDVEEIVEDVEVEETEEQIKQKQERLEREKKWKEARDIIKREESQRLPTPAPVPRTKPPINLTLSVHSGIFSISATAPAVDVVEVDPLSPLIHIQVNLRTTRRDIGSILDRILSAFVRDFSPKEVLTTLPQLHFIPALLGCTLVRTTVILPYEYDVTAIFKFAFQSSAPLGALGVGRNDGSAAEDQELLRHLHDVLASRDTFLFAHLPPPHNEITPPKPHRRGFLQGIAIAPSGSTEVMRRLQILRTEDPDDRNALYMTVVVLNCGILASRELDHLF
ncbi:uncharacterized protein EI90DRAFT_3027422 [Cantharellus anzutake]|uniref:uncharacterized protein n=1 Tax=Cantharellus anzutake TaxID=1750568 RepID=UPI001903B5B7|nr:uncharacterized protein EI90DRAFT_3027422 [Cantharellus anzutake]KAF8343878.1 hypothetical protein EI90DRAFT_3027422 [Cantharellus anzutake]